MNTDEHRLFPFTLDLCSSVFICGYSKSLTLRFEVNEKPEGGLVAEGHVVLACVSRSTFESVPIPAEIVEALKPYLA